MLSDERIEAIFLSVDSENKGRFAIVRLFARAIEAEVRKQDDVLIRQMLEALAKASVALRIGHDKLVAIDETAAAITAAKARQGINT